MKRESEAGTQLEWIILAASVLRPAVGGVFRLAVTDEQALAEAGGGQARRGLPGELNGDIHH